ncbi:MAG TPA: 3-deoxy-D-manno-octulosonic acid kinase [Dokdonella sp.]|uniref:3-deoxy-D-manno-octulosonic acid kinase n=1 Tax=Dokdonella sp. TaxID=2291710 RepID=UPI002B91523E|nr:3-deoxy-D-manno-octulosonic acid kinase [Dokdonella sp.]HUD40475.1 3-deoxy-D-manno-octulosonic acid kinase [Dokdonella sp.]
MIDAQVQPMPDGAVLYDAAAFGAAPQAACFEPAAAAAAWPRGGRGGVALVDTPAGRGVLRHYRRGGLAARFSADRYLWLGLERTRAFREFRLLMHLRAAGLAVPAPLAARVQREGLRYRADLVTGLIADARTLAETIHDGRADGDLAARIGQAIARLHGAGCWHADLNAHNVLIDATGTVWLIDFDRGRLRAPALGWQQQNLARLHRSLEKIGARRQSAAFDARFWHPLLAAYHAGLAGAATTRGLR